MCKWNRRKKTKPKRHSKQFVDFPSKWNKIRNEISQHTILRRRRTNRKESRERVYVCVCVRAQKPAIEFAINKNKSEQNRNIAILHSSKSQRCSFIYSSFLVEIVVFQTKNRIAIVKKKQCNIFKYRKKSIKNWICFLNPNSNQIQHWIFPPKKHEFNATKANK